MKKMRIGPREKLLNMSPDTPVRIYTLQNPEAVKTALECGYFTGSHPFSYMRTERHPEVMQNFVDAYEWMRQSMAARMDEFSGDLPVWGWLQRPSGRKIRDDEPVIRVTAIIPCKRMLLSSHDAWHMPLNGSPLLPTEGVWDIWHNLSPENRGDMKSTWNSVFDLRKKTIDEAQWMGQPDYVQACIDRVLISEVVGMRALRRPGHSYSLFSEETHKLSMVLREHTVTF